MRIKCYFLYVLLFIFVCGCVDDTSEVPPNEDKRFLLHGKSGDETRGIEHRLKYADSALTVSSEKVVFDSLHMAIISRKGMLHFQAKQRDSFYFYYKLLWNLAKLMQNDYYLGRASYNLGFYYDELKRTPDSAYFYYNEAKNSHEQLKDSSTTGRTLLNMAIIQKNQNDLFGAKETLTEALEYIKISKKGKFLASVYSELGTNHRKLLNFEDAVAYFERAIATSNNRGDIGKYKNNLAVTYTEMGKYHKAKVLFEELLKSDFMDKQSNQYARVLHNYTYTQWKNGEDRVENNFKKALELRKNNADQRGLISSYTDIGEYYSRKDPDRAIRYLDTVIDLSKKIKVPKAETDALNLLMELQSGNTAIKNRYIFLKDSLYRRELQVKTQFAKMRYDYEQEKNKLKSLETETAERKAQLAEQKTQNVLFIALSGLLFVGSVSFYYLLRQRHKKEKLKTRYNTEKAISKRLHDELSNDIFGLMVNVQQEQEGNEYMLDSLERIYNHTRNISHDHQEIILGSAFGEELRQMLAGFYTEETSIVVKDLEQIDWAKVSEFSCVALFRSLKELMVNMKKHSSATLVAIHFEQEKKQLHIRYSDNGIGMESNQKFGVGLKNTVSRIDGVNGKIIFDTKEQGGTKIIITVPR